MHDALARRLRVGRPLYEARAALAALGFRCSVPTMVDSAGTPLSGPTRLLWCNYHQPGTAASLRAWDVVMPFRTDSVGDPLRTFTVSQPAFLERYGRELSGDSLPAPRATQPAPRVRRARRSAA
jgi:hypothetical protein